MEGALSPAKVLNLPRKRKLPAGFLTAQDQGSMLPKGI